MKLGEEIKRGIDTVLDLVYPQGLYCHCCGNAIDDSRTYRLCDHCISRFRWDGEEPKEVGGMKMMRCVEYGLYERTLIFSLKYNGKKYIARDIGQIMADRLSLSQVEFDVILPVPLHPDKERRRGFNQAALMGKYLGKLTGKPCIAHGLLRMTDTKPMRGLSPEERIENVKGKFALNEKYVTMFRGKRVLLIDDFYTTGSTAQACRAALLEGEPAEVLFLAFAAR